MNQDKYDKYIKVLDTLYPTMQGHIATGYVHIFWTDPKLLLLNQLSYGVMVGLNTYQHAIKEHGKNKINSKNE